MSIWQTLGITQTNDEKEIRRAYARQVKKYRPDSHPEEYQQLREAFEEAKDMPLTLFMMMNLPMMNMLKSRRI